MEVLLLARWSRVLGRLTQRGFALACGFLLLCLSRTPLFLCFAAIVAPDTISAVPVHVAGSRRAAACVELPGSPDRCARGTAVFLVHDSMQQTRGLARRLDSHATRPRHVLRENGVINIEHCADLEERAFIFAAAPEGSSTRSRRPWGSSLK